MVYLIAEYGFITAYLIGTLSMFAIYFLLTYIAFLLAQKGPSWGFNSIQARLPSRAQIIRESKHGLAAVIALSFSIVLIYWAYISGWSKIYFILADKGALYFGFSLLFLVFLYDTYFYWLHRLWHHRSLYMLVHQAHHKSRVSNPFSALSLDFVEALSLVLFLPIVVLLIPLHPLALYVYFAINIFHTIISHLGIECMPARWVHHPITKWINTATFHDMHHQKANGNFSFFLNFWDRWMGTFHADYETTFARIVKPQS